MNPLVEKMLNATVSNDVETRLLEDLFEHEAKCESRTHADGTVTCSKDVGYLLESCLPVINVCTNMGVSSLEAIRMEQHMCGHCGIPIEKCWTIRPI